jgi:hypothetical protein
MNGWTEIWTGGIDYTASFLAPRNGLILRASPSYDKYGRVFAALATDYALTPDLTLRGITNLSWTDTAADTKGPTSTGSCRAGSSRPGIPSGAALDIHSADAKDVYKLTGRFRITF